MYDVCLRGLFFHWPHHTTHKYPLQPPILTIILLSVDLSTELGKSSYAYRGKKTTLLVVESVVFLSLFYLVVRSRLMTLPNQIALGRKVRLNVFAST